MKNRSFTALPFDRGTLYSVLDTVDGGDEPGGSVEEAWCCVAADRGQLSLSFGVRCHFAVGGVDAASLAGRGVLLEWSAMRK